MSNKKQLLEKAASLGIETNSRTTVEELEKAIAERENSVPDEKPIDEPVQDGEQKPTENDAPNEDGGANDSDNHSVKFNPDLVETVKANSHILNVWVSESGDWYFRATPGFVSYSREEILNG